MDLALLLGRFHVLVLHLPIGLIVVAVVVELLGVAPGWRRLDAAAPFLWALAAATAVLTAALGLLHVGEGGFDRDIAAAHRTWGIALALSTCGIWLLRTRAKPARAIRVAAAIAIVPVMILTGHYGGELTHGATYLTEHAPRPLLGLAGAEQAMPDDPPAERRSLEAAAALRATGLLVRAVSAASADDESHWIVGTRAPGTALGDDALEALAAAQAFIVELSVPAAGLTDADLAMLEGFHALEAIRLDSNAIGDATIRVLRGLPALRVLNVYGNVGITDASVELLAAMPALESVYVWGTSMTPGGVERLEALKPDLTVQAGTALEFLNE